MWWREGGDGLPPVDMYLTGQEVMVKTAMPGVKPGEVDITITGATLTLKGETKASEEVKREDCVYREHRCGAFSRTRALPTDLHTEKAEATFENGILTLTIPRAKEARPPGVLTWCVAGNEGCPGSSHALT